MKQARIYLILLFLSLGFVVKGQSYLTTLKNTEDFERLASDPLSAKYGQIKAVKVIYDLKSERLYFANSKRYDFHYAFCYEILENQLEIDVFNKRNYGFEEGRTYLLADLNLIKDQKIYFLELAPVEQMSTRDIKLLYQKVNEAIRYPKDLNFLLNSPQLNHRSEDLKPIPTLRPEEVYGNINYQALSVGKTKGRLKFISDHSQGLADLAPQDIIVLKSSPLYIPEVAGIIVEEFQTPLSHISILARNRGIPIAADKTIWNNKKALSLEGQNVKFQVLAHEIKLEAYHKKLKTPKLVKTRDLKFDLAQKNLVLLPEMGFKSVDQIGNKAANLGELHRLSKEANFKTPEGAFAIPFYFYNQHVSAHGIQQKIDSLLTHNNGTISSEQLKKELKEIRHAIKSQKINPDLIKAVNAQVDQKYMRYRFRSSTNAEDQKGFSGAGLYSSRTGVVNDSVKSFEKAIKKVWASLWSYEAFKERALYKLNQKQVYMGVLVHRSFPNEAVNGVVITKNIYRKDNPGYVVNAQLGNENVVDAKSGISSDEFICYPENKKDIYGLSSPVEIITSSSLNQGNLVMTEDEIQNLANCLYQIERYYRKKQFKSRSLLELGLDLEFKLDGPQRTLYLKQVRYFND